MILEFKGKYFFVDYTSKQGLISIKSVKYCGRELKRYPDGMEDSFIDQIRDIESYRDELGRADAEQEYKDRIRGII